VARGTLKAGFSLLNNMKKERSPKRSSKIKEEKNESLNKDLNVRFHHLNCPWSGDGEVS